MMIINQLLLLCCTWCSKPPLSRGNPITEASAAAYGEIFVLCVIIQVLGHSLILMYKIEVHGGEITQPCYNNFYTKSHNSKLNLLSQFYYHKNIQESQLVHSLRVTQGALLTFYSARVKPNRQL